MLTKVARASLGALMIAASLGALPGAATHAQSVGPSAPPANVNVSRPTVTGTLVARPGGRTIPIPARCRTTVGARAAALQPRGLVICSDSGKLVLLEVTSLTGIYARYWGRYAVGYLREGDRINAWGVLDASGMLLNPTFAVQDVDLQEALVDSEDFITVNGWRLTLDVLSSDPGSPVQGMVHAVPGGRVHITLCNGAAGKWRGLAVGERIAITRGLFNRRLMTYIHTTDVRVAGCS
jgi:hypothetical protein